MLIIGGVILQLPVLYELERGDQRDKLAELHSEIISNWDWNCLYCRECISNDLLTRSWSEAGNGH